ncbi:hypothetical protein CKAH01_13802 [Colletotrichum kahawae]|uniref:Uncharacterized protein n=1 Tax=Colletotrichum kahawae TaxID=34407 RepID=A0AAD9YPR2_COLKA|nr:hypothetical protein CKAH01_13802 [Colletotrichum kahawae]
MGDPTAKIVRETWMPSVNGFRFPEEVYSNNTAYFLSLETRMFFEKEETKVLNALVYLVLSVDLIERLSPGAASEMGI